MKTAKAIEQFTTPRVYLYTKLHYTSYYMYVSSCCHWFIQLNQNSWKFNCEEFKFGCEKFKFNCEKSKFNWHLFVIYRMVFFLFNCAVWFSLVWVLINIVDFTYIGNECAHENSYYMIIGNVAFFPCSICCIVALI